MEIKLKLCEQLIGDESSSFLKSSVPITKPKIYLYDDLTSSEDE